MSAESGVYAVHHRAEQSSVGTRVLQLVAGDVVVYHLVYDSILHYFLRQVKPCVDAQHEIVVHHLAHQSVAFLLEAAHAEKPFGVAKPYGYVGQFAVEHHPVVFVEFLLDEWNGWCHAVVVV